MAVHPTDPATRRRRPWFELRKARTDAHLTKTALANAAGFSVPYLVLLEQGKRRPSRRALAALTVALGIPIEDLAPRPFTERPDDVARLLRALPHGIRAQMPLEPAGTQFGNCQWCDDETGIGDARIRITWSPAGSVEAGLVEVCPACLFDAVDDVLTEADGHTTPVVEYTIVAPAETLPNAA